MGGSSLAIVRRAAWIARMVYEGAGSKAGSLRAAFELIAALYSPQLLGWNGPRPEEYRQPAVLEAATRAALKAGNRPHNYSAILSEAMPRSEIGISAMSRKTIETAHILFPRVQATVSMLPRGSR